MGHHNVRFDGDRYALEGAWSPPTSRANFCEEDYVLTFYLAEFINSLTNIAYVILAFRAMYGPGRGWLAPKLDLMSLSLLVLGVGSFLFHATLRQALEFVDELSMLGLAWSMMQAMFAVRQTPAMARVSTILLTAALLAFGAFYVYTAKIIYQVIAFFVCMGLLGVRTHYVAHWSQPRFSEAKIREWDIGAWKAVAICLFGYLLWNIDLEYCKELRAIREYVGLPFAWLFELHGWWHIFTAIGAAMFMDVVRDMRTEAEMMKKK
jgi:dihydroceramidase